MHIVKSKIVILTAIIIAVLYACSTEKNSLLSRSYHGLNAHYNGYFNANDLIRTSIETYRTNKVENYYTLLEIDPVPDEDEVIALYPALDTAIAKCMKVIRNHSMPSNDRPALKKEEHNKWIDENWTTIGIASYYRRDYENAMKSFNYVRKFYSNDPSLFIGELWMAKTFIGQGNLSKAKLHLDNLDKAILDEESRNEDKKFLSGLKKTKKGEEEKAKFPKEIRFDLEKTKADLALRRGETKDAIKYLEESLKFAKKGASEARVHFILGQLYEQEGDKVNAKNHYNAVIKGNAPYSMSFNSRLKRSLMGGGDKMRKELNKMLHDAKNAEFKDQIYYAFAELEFDAGNESKGIEYLTLSAFYSTINKRQKAMAYEKLGNLSFAKRQYVVAQKYYDSCVVVIPEDYPNAQGIRNKATNLKNLVVAVETAHYEDSVQRIALLSESDREEFLKDLIKRIKEEEEQRKIREAQKLRELQKNLNVATGDASGSKWYWNNEKSKAEGYDEFRRLWGTRENEDDWRRAEKTPVGIVDSEIPDSVIVEEIVKTNEDTLTIEYLSANLPFTDSAVNESNKRLVSALFSAGIIYKDQLNESKLAEKQFNAIIDKNIESDFNLPAAFQLYRMFEGQNEAEANKYKNYILNNYPNSDYANYIRDPNYFIKKKEREAEDEKEYVTVLDRYERGLYYPVILKANDVIAKEKENKYRAKYMLLKALSIGKQMEIKDSLVPVLNMVIAEYPQTPEAVRAQEMLDIIKNGYSENVPFDNTDDSPFKYSEGKHYIIVFLEPKENSNSAKVKVVDFHREFFSRDNLKVSSRIYGKETSFILIEDFETEMKASQYISVYKKTRKHLMDLQNAKILMISNENMKVLLQSQNLEEYEKFYEKYYE